MSEAMKLPFNEIAKKIRKSRDNTDPQPHTLICFDPGETTGYAIFNDYQLIAADQLATKDLVEGSKRIMEILEGRNPENTLVIMEDYRIYGWKTEQHTWAGLHTPKLVGAIIAICVMYDLKFILQMAYQGKQFVTDDKLEAWGFYKSGLRHGRDAIRHGCYYRMFGAEQMDPKSGPKHGSKKN